MPLPCHAEAQLPLEDFHWQPVPVAFLCKVDPADTYPTMHDTFDTDQRSHSRPAQSCGTSAPPSGSIAEGTWLS